MKQRNNSDNIKENNNNNLRKRILFIDNFDSFIYNLVDEFRKLNCEVLIYRNNISMKKIDDIVKGYNPDLIVISPGPSKPKDAGICISLIKEYYDKIPLLGICLGHQCMIEAMGGTVKKANFPVHGKKSEIIHNGSDIFKGIPNNFHAGRYHSLYGSKITDFFEICARTDDKIPMAISNYEYRVFGFQFHPESILTAHGSLIIKNIIGVLR